jgi:hypothetical protein
MRRRRPVQGLDAGSIFILIQVKQTKSQAACLRCTLGLATAGLLQPSGWLTVLFWKLSGFCELPPATCTGISFPLFSHEGSLGVVDNHKPGNKHGRNTRRSCYNDLMHG